MTRTFAMPGRIESERQSRDPADSLLQEFFLLLRYYHRQGAVLCVTLRPSSHPLFSRFWHDYPTLRAPVQAVAKTSFVYADHER